MASRNSKRKQSGITISSFFVQSSDSENKKEQVKKQKESTEESRGFLQSWLVEFEWLRYNKESNVMYCDFCQRAGRVLAGNIDFYGGSSKFKKENIKAHGKSLKQ